MINLIRNFKMFIGNGNFIGNHELLFNNLKINICARPVCLQF